MIDIQLKNKLASWLYNGKRDYLQGVEIFSSISSDPDQIKFFKQQRASKVHMSILQRKLAHFARLNNIAPAPMPVSEKNTTASTGKQKNKIGATGMIARPKVDKNPVVRYEDLPGNLQVLFDENGRISTETKAYHAELKQLKDSDDIQAKERRKILTEAILSGQKIWRKNWDEIDLWWSKKMEDDPLKRAAEEALAKDRRIKANLAYIRRFIGKAKAKEEVELRMKELDKWNIDYGNLTRNFKGIWTK
jgi:hypothetical protein